MANIPNNLWSIAWVEKALSNLRKSHKAGENASLSEYQKVAKALSEELGSPVSVKQVQEQVQNIPDDPRQMLLGADTRAQIRKDNYAAEAVKGRAARQAKKLSAMKSKPRALSSDEAQKLALQAPDDIHGALEGVASELPDTTPLNEHMRELGFGSKAEAVQAAAKKKLGAAAEPAIAKAMGGEAAAGAVSKLAPMVEKGGFNLLSKIGGWGTVGALALPLVAEHLPGIVEGAKDKFGPLLGHDFAADKLQRVLDAQDQIGRFTRAQQRRQQDLEQLVNVNTQMLAQNAPHLFNQIMAGRELPDGATVIGGQPRTDLMREVAMQMSQGGFQQQQQGGQPNASQF